MRPAQYIMAALRLFKSDPIIIVPYTILGFYIHLFSPLEAIIATVSLNSWQWWGQVLLVWVLDTMSMGVTLAMAIQLMGRHPIRVAAECKLVLHRFPQLFILHGVSVLPTFVLGGYLDRKSVV